MVELNENALGRFGHHPDPAIDFEIEVQSLEARLFDAKGGISKPGTEPETVAAVLTDIERAMEFRVGGDPSAVAAKQVLRRLEAEAKSALPASDDGLAGVDIEQLARTIVLTCQYSWPKDRVKAFERAERLISSALQSKDEQIERLTRERDIALENYTRAWNERDAQRRRAEAAEQQVRKLTAENERLRGVLEAADYLIDRLRNAWFGNAVRDMDEAEVAYTTARTALETQEGER